MVALQWLICAALPLLAMLGEAGAEDSPQMTKLKMVKHDDDGQRHEEPEDHDPLFMSREFIDELVQDADVDGDGGLTMEEWADGLAQTAWERKLLESGWRHGLLKWATKTFPKVAKKNEKLRGHRLEMVMHRLHDTIAPRNDGIHEERPRAEKHGGVKVSFSNMHATEPMEMFWVNQQDGSRSSFGTISPSSKKGMETYAGHVWEFTNAENSALRWSQQIRIATGNNKQSFKLNPGAPKDEL